MAENSQIPLKHIHSLTEQEGFIVCTSCGEVCEDMVFETKNFTGNCEIKPQIHKNDFDLLYELKSRDIINQKIIDYSKFFVKKWREEKIPLQKYHLAYAIFYSSRVLKHPISLKEISYYTQLSVKDICKVERYIKNNFYISPHEYVEKFCKMLDLTFMDEKIIKNYLSAITSKYYKNINPSLLTASVISLVFPAISKNDLSSITQVSAGSIRKTAREISEIVNLTNKQKESRA